MSEPMICPKCRHEIYEYPCTHCGYNVHSGKITKTKSAPGKLTLKEIGILWKAETPAFRKSMKWIDYIKTKR